MSTGAKRKLKDKTKDSAKVIVKSEQQELQPLSHYVDDRVELVQQIFQSLKSRTIKSLAPPFLQDKTLEVIHGYCLEEILGISKKRLLSIINAAKCPSDTESTDSDVQNIEDHISLEEISSDSADEDKVVKSKPEIRKKILSAKTVTTGDSSKKEMSILELLELQARARAIRSQLALEPVTKIELDSDDNSISSVSSKFPTNHGKQNRSEQQNGDTNETTLTKKMTKPVRLKRNFRQRQLDPEDNNQNNGNDLIKPHTTAEEEPIEESSTPVKAELPSETPCHSKSIYTNQINKSPSPQERKRSPSPDVITIVPSPETLFISSESEDEHHHIKTKYLGTVTIPSPSSRPETEDEIFLRKIKEANSDKKTMELKLSSEQNSNKSATKEKSDQFSNGAKSNSSENVEKPVVDECRDNNTDIEPTIDVVEPEEGEICETESEDERSNSRNEDKVEVDLISDTEEIEEKSNSDENIKSELANEQSEKIASNEDIEKVDKMDEDEEIEVNANNEDSSIQAEDVIQIIEDDDEDIIDLGKDEDFEMKGDSDEERNDDVVKGEESWGSRWLKGKNVSKIMATSKLANRVRTKIKQKKVTTDSKNLLESAVDVTPNLVENEHFEEGSVEHYKNILLKDKDDNIENILNE